MSRTNTLTYSFTKIFGAAWLPDFVIVEMVNDVQFVSFDSNTMKLKSHHNWIEKGVSQEEWEAHTSRAFHEQDFLRERLGAVMKKFIHSGGVHTFQRVAGCELDDDGTSRIFYQDAYDGKEFLSLDLERETWIAAMQQAVFFKQILQASKAYILNSYKEECVYWLKRYLEKGRNIFKRRVRPKVRLLEKKAVQPAGSEVTCHVTGFYPRDIEVTWLKDGQGPLEEGVWSGEVLPNHDGTYQVRKTLTVSPEEQERHRYTCQVDHASLGVKIAKEWGTGSNTGIIFSVVVSALLLITVIIAGVLIFKKRQAGVKTLDYTAAQRLRIRASVPDRKLVFVETEMTWSEAQSYCRNMYTDLATVSNQGVAEQLLNIRGASLSDAAWIGLYRDDTQNWQWSNSDDVVRLAIFDWKAELFCASVSSQGEWEDKDCYEGKAFMCYKETSNITERYTLIEELKTWTEAQQYCREHHTDLVSIKRASENEDLVKKAQGVPFWIGLFNVPWKWSHQGDNYTFHTWKNGEPDNAKGIESVHHTDHINIKSASENDEIGKKVRIGNQPLLLRV
ncbi:major histocompatibility complex class I-related gene protein-like [Polyodon spathula]|uniref:major histocompatibility complex class I-related gene protein-like n=1 Tax=Polyodon spathula TaxID=7913 RepID=UPI001B7DF094|nr:major histocompatibility complex class I-related gene protein-like [Polyodon spathula]